MTNLLISRKCGVLVATGYLSKKDPAPVTQKDDIQMKYFQKFVKCLFFCAESESAIRFPEFGFNHPLGVTKGQKKKFQNKQQISHIYVLNSVENDSECQKPKNPILIRFGYYLCRNDIQ